MTEPAAKVFASLRCNSDLPRSFIKMQSLSSLWEVVLSESVWAIANIPLVGLSSVEGLWLAAIISIVVLSGPSPLVAVRGVAQAFVIAKVLAETSLLVFVLLLKLLNKLGELSVEVRAVFVIVSVKLQQVVVAWLG